MSILVENVSKNFGPFRALDHVNLEIKSGSLVALVGPSGSGKSTLLRMIGGLDQPDEGKIWLSGKDATYTSIQDRKIGFVFQNYALFKKMTVYQNIAFGLEVHQEKHKSFGPGQIHKRVVSLLQLIRLEALADRYPEALSGGQRQRVALARALAMEPKVLLLDEPFGALDAQVRKELRSWLRALHEKMPVTTVFVTHDQQEAMEVANEIVIFNEGRIEQIGNPKEVYDNPATPFVMRFMGPVNLVPSPSYPPEGHLGDPAPPASQYAVRPHEFYLEPQAKEGYEAVRIERVSYGGNSIKIDVYIPSVAWDVRIHMSPQKWIQLAFGMTMPFSEGTILYLDHREESMFARTYTI